MGEKVNSHNRYNCTAFHYRKQEIYNSKRRCNRNRFSNNISPLQQQQYLYQGICHSKRRGEKKRSYSNISRSQQQQYLNQIICDGKQIGNNKQYSENNIGSSQQLQYRHLGRESSSRSTSHCFPNPVFIIGAVFFVAACSSLVVVARPIGSRTVEVTPSFDTSNLPNSLNYNVTFLQSRNGATPPNSIETGYVRDLHSQGINFKNDLRDEGNKTLKIIKDKGGDFKETGKNIYNGVKDVSGDISNSTSSLFNRTKEEVGNFVSKFKDKKSTMLASAKDKKTSIQKKYKDEYTSFSDGASDRFNSTASKLNKYRTKASSFIKSHTGNYTDSFKEYLNEQPEFLEFQQNREIIVSNCKARAENLKNATNSIKELDENRLASHKKNTKPGKFNIKFCGKRPESYMKKGTDLRSCYGFVKGLVNKSIRPIKKGLLPESTGEKIEIVSEKVGQVNKFSSMAVDHIIETVEDFKQLGFNATDGMANFTQRKAEELKSDLGALAIKVEGVVANNSEIVQGVVKNTSGVMRYTSELADDYNQDLKNIPGNYRKELNTSISNALAKVKNSTDEARDAEATEFKDYFDDRVHYHSEHLRNVFTNGTQNLVDASNLTSVVNFTSYIELFKKNKDDFINFIDEVREDFFSYVASLTALDTSPFYIVKLLMSGGALFMYCVVCHGTRNARYPRPVSDRYLDSNCGTIAEIEPLLEDQESLDQKKLDPKQIEEFIRNAPTRLKELEDMYNETILK